MRVKLIADSVRYRELEAELKAHGIEVDPEASLVLTEESRYPDRLICRKGEAYCPVELEKIVYIESLGHGLSVFTDKDCFSLRERLLRLESLLPPECFLRISNCCIVNRDKILEIRPTLGSKFHLKMQNGTIVDVTRSYAAIFRERMGF